MAKMRRAVPRYDGSYRSNAPSGSKRSKVLPRARSAASNETPEGRALNRRTEFFFYFPSSISLDENYGVRLVIDRE